MCGGVYISDTGSGERVNRRQSHNNTLRNLISDRCRWSIDRSTTFPSSFDTRLVHPPTHLATRLVPSLPLPVQYSQARHHLPITSHHTRSFIVQPLSPYPGRVSRLERLPRRPTLYKSARIGHPLSPSLSLSLSRPLSPFPRSSLSLHVSSLVHVEPTPPGRSICHPTSSPTADTDIHRSVFSARRATFLPKHVLTCH